MPLLFWQSEMIKNIALRNQSILAPGKLRGIGNSFSPSAILTFWYPIYILMSPLVDIFLENILESIILWIRSFLSFVLNNKDYVPISGMNSPEERWGGRVYKEFKGKTGLTNINIKGWVDIPVFNSSACLWSFLRKQS